MKAREKAQTHAESVVYLGRTVVGKIEIRRRGELLAFDAAGEAIGTFATDRLAMGAILRKARAAREGST